MINYKKIFIAAGVVVAVAAITVTTVYAAFFANSSKEILLESGDLAVSISENDSSNVTDSNITTINLSYAVENIGSVAVTMSDTIELEINGKYLSSNDNIAILVNDIETEMNDGIIIIPDYILSSTEEVADEFDTTTDITITIVVNCSVYYGDFNTTLYTSAEQVRNGGGWSVDGIFNFNSGYISIYDPLAGVGDGDGNISGGNLFNDIFKTKIIVDTSEEYEISDDPITFSYSVSSNNDNNPYYASVTDIITITCSDGESSLNIYDYLTILVNGESVSINTNNGMITVPTYLIAASEDIKEESVEEEITQIAIAISDDIEPEIFDGTTLSISVYSKQSYYEAEVQKSGAYKYLYFNNIELSIPTDDITQESNISLFYDYTYINIYGGYEVSLKPAFAAALNTNENYVVDDETLWEVGTALPDPGSTYDDGDEYGEQAVTSMYNMFAYSTAISLDLSKWNTSNVTTMYGMFYDCTGLSELDVSDWDVSSVTKMSCMFYNCTSLETLNLSNWNVENVTTMASMFTNCDSLITVGDLSDWEVSSVTSMIFMFSGCSLLEELNISDWDVSSVTSMRAMFYDCTSLEELNISDWDVSSVTNMSFMFQYCTSLKELDLSSWNVKEVTTMLQMFLNCNNLTTVGDLSNWNVGNVTNMQLVFHGCHKLTTVGNLSKWNVENVEAMSSMFGACYELITVGDLNSWDVSSVTNMSHMFQYCNSLEELNINDWEVSSVTTMYAMFTGCTSLETLDISDWVVSSVTSMEYMFSYSSALKTLYLSDWDVSSVTAMEGMFYGCTTLEELNINNWDVSSVTIMDRMFFSCTSLETLYLSDWDTNSWDLLSLTEMDGMFSDCSADVYVNQEIYDILAGNTNDTDITWMLPYSETLYTVTYNISQDNVDFLTVRDYSDGTTITMPTSYYNIYDDGLYQTGWTDGNDIYYFGDSYTVTSDVTFEIYNESIENTVTFTNMSYAIADYFDTDFIPFDLESSIYDSFAVELGDANAFVFPEEPELIYNEDNAFVIDAYDVAFDYYYVVVMSDFSETSRFIYETYFCYPGETFSTEKYTTNISIIIYPDLSISGDAVVYIQNDEGVFAQYSEEDFLNLMVLDYVSLTSYANMDSSTYDNQKIIGYYVDDIYYPIDENTYQTSRILVSSTETYATAVYADYTATATYGLENYSCIAGEEIVLPELEGNNIYLINNEIYYTNVISTPTEKDSNYVVELVEDESLLIKSTFELPSGYFYVEPTSGVDWYGAAYAEVGSSITYYSLPEEAIVVPTMTICNYDILNTIVCAYYTDAEKDYDLGAEIYPINDTTYYGVIENNTLTITFDYGLDNFEKQTIIYENSNSQIYFDAETKAYEAVNYNYGYEITGWVDDAGNYYSLLSAPCVLEFLSFQIHPEITLYAVWEPVEIVFEYYCQGERCVGVISYGETFTFPEASDTDIEEYYYINVNYGYNYDDDDELTIYYPGQTITIDESVTVRDDYFYEYDGTIYYSQATYTMAFTASAVLDITFTFNNGGYNITVPADIIIDSTQDVYESVDVSVSSYLDFYGWEDANGVQFFKSVDGETTYAAALSSNMLSSTGDYSNYVLSGLIEYAGQTIELYPIFEVEADKDLSYYDYILDGSSGTYQVLLSEDFKSAIINGDDFKNWSSDEPFPSFATSVNGVTITSTASLFESLYIETLNFDNFDMSNIIDASMMFKDFTTDNAITLDWTLDNATNLEAMFYAASIPYLDLTNFYVNEDAAVTLFFQNFIGSGVVNESFSEILLHSTSYFDTEQFTILSSIRK